jgi:nicotinamidase-related amidase
MSIAFPIDPDRTAVLNMDCQAGIVSIYTKGDQDVFLARAASVLNHARASHMTVIHVKVGFRPSPPEVSSRNQLSGAMKAPPQHQSVFQEPLVSIHPALAPTENEIIVPQHRVSAFTTTDLLRANNIETLVLFGISTSGVVLSALLEASDSDYRLAVIKDCCADLDADLHESLFAKLFPSRATVLSAADFIKLTPIPDTPRQST